MKLLIQKRVIYLMIALILPCWAEGATWVKLNENSQSKLLLDKQSIVQKDQLTRAWVKIEYKTPQVNIDSADKTYNLSKLLWHFDCAAQKTATTQVFQYMNSEAVYSAVIEVKGAEFIEPMSESDLDIAMRYVCASYKPPKAQASVNAVVTTKKTATQPKTEASATQAALEPSKVAEKKPEVAKTEPSPAVVKEVKKEDAKKAETKATDPKKDEVKKDEAKKEDLKKTETAKDEAKKEDGKKAEADKKALSDKESLAALKAQAMANLALKKEKEKQKQTEKEGHAETETSASIKNIKPSFGKKTKAVAWAYDDKSGPEEWAKLSPDFALCASGKNQSPIDISVAADASMKALKGIQKMAIKELIITEQALQANVKEGNMLLLDDVAYQMKHIQFHVPSEHLIKGKSFPIEAHIMHADSKGNVVVMAVFYKEGPANTALEKLLTHIPKEVGVAAPINDKMTANEFLPENRNYYRVTGSLTTPPCTEGVSWVIYKTPLTASKAQISALEQVLKHPNNRPAQPLNGRLVVE